MFRTSQVFVTKTFARWMRKSQVTDLDILGATEEMVQGLIDANLGGYLVKKASGNAGPWQKCWL